MSVQVLQLAKCNMAQNFQHNRQSENVVLRVKRLTRQSIAVTEALADVPLRFSLVKPDSRRLHLS